MTDDELKNLTPLKQALCVLMAGEIGAGEEFDIEYMDVLINIGKAMFWSKRYDVRVRQIVYDFEQEADNYKREYETGDCIKEPDLDEFPRDDEPREYHI